MKGESVPLSAFAYDADIGEVPHASISWSPSIDGALGTGATLTVTKLSVGSHTITVTAKDAADLPLGTATTTTIVVAKSADLPKVADKLVLEPDVLLFDGRRDWRRRRWRF